MLLKWSRSISSTAQHRRHRRHDGDRGNYRYCRSWVGLWAGWLEYLGIVLYLEGGQRVFYLGDAQRVFYLGDAQGC